MYDEWADNKRFVELNKPDSHTKIATKAVKKNSVTTVIYKDLILEEVDDVYFIFVKYVSDYYGLGSLNDVFKKTYSAKMQSLVPNFSTVIKKVTP